VSTDRNPILPFRRACHPPLSPRVCFGELAAPLETTNSISSSQKELRIHNASLYDMPSRFPRSSQLVWAARGSLGGRRIHPGSRSRPARAPSDGCSRTDGAETETSAATPVSSVEALVYVPVARNSGRDLRKSSGVRRAPRRRTSSPRSDAWSEREAGGTGIDHPARTPSFLHAMERRRSLGGRRKHLT
jgi:hypothetical protein